MIGFRPNRGCHDDIKKFNVTLEKRKTSGVLDAETKGFFDQLDHERIAKLLKSCIKALNDIRLIRRITRGMLKRKERVIIDFLIILQGNYANNTIDYGSRYRFSIWQWNKTIGNG